MSVFLTADSPVSALADLRNQVGSGALIVLPTDTVYGIAAHPTDPQAVQSLLAAKGRQEDQPPPVLVPSVRALEEIADPNCPGTQVAFKLAEAFWPGPLTLVVSTTVEFGWGGPTVGTVALRMPDQALALKVLQETGPLAVSSANKAGCAPAVTVAQARSYFGDKVAVYVDAGPSAGGVASTIVDTTAATMRLLRPGPLGWGELESALQ